MNAKAIESFLIQRFPGNGRPKAVRDEISDACNDFVKSGLADSNFIIELCSGSEKRFWSRVSEALLAARLKKIGLTPEPPSGGGPDFYVIEEGQKIWIEIICPEPTGVPSDWLEPEMGTVISFPHEQILLRWTSAIKEKAEKLLGSLDGTVKGYIEKGLVASSDAYVIAVNACKLRSGPFPELFGISQFPFAVEAVFAVGPYQIKINRDTMKQTGTSYQHRPLIAKPKGASVPAYIFLDPRFTPISAIWAVDVNGASAIGNSEPMAVVHNPNADNPIPIGFLPAHDEYVATPIGTEEYELNRLKGNLSSIKQEE
jgi:type I restriction enzyme S subunit